jgi:transposase InsO family protein
VLIARLWPGWREALVIVRPETVLAWHRQGFRLFWRRKSQAGRTGRPEISAETIALIRRMNQENPLWGAPRIHGELRKLGIKVAQSTVAKYVVRRPGPRGSGQSWTTFLRNHLGETAAVDFFVVPTLTFRLLFVFVVLTHDRRRIQHIGVTHHPTSAWTAQQTLEAFPWNTTPRYLIRDRDGIYSGSEFGRMLGNLEIEDTPTAPRSPWQNPYVERVIGSIRRECTDHVIAINERQLIRVLRQYQKYYNASRTHLGIGKDAPDGRAVEAPDIGKIVARPVLGGLHHRYLREAA